MTRAQSETRVALITGAGSGIGRAIAIELSQLGYATVLVGRNRASLDETASQLSGGNSLVLPADITRPTDAAALITQTIARFTRLDALVNNAGFAPLRTIEKMTIDEWRQVIDTNLSAAFYLSKAAWPHMKRQGGGVIVNLSSEASRDPFEGLAAYGAAKAALNLLGLALAREGTPHNIRLHTIAPGAVETQMLRSIVSTDQFPTEKTLSPQDVARVIAQCVQGHLQYTSGEVIYLHKRT